MSWIGGDGEGGAGIHIIKSMNHQIDCLGKKKKLSRFQSPVFPFFSPFLSSPLRSTPVIMALTSLAGKRTKTGTEDTANVGFHFSKRKWDIQKTPKQTKITAESAFGTVKSSPKERRGDIRTIYCRIPTGSVFRVNPGGKGDLWVSWLYYFIFSITITKGFGFFSVIAYLGSCHGFPW